MIDSITLNTLFVSLFILKFKNQSYNRTQIEWDTAAGIPEVQRIATSLNLNTNEIQAITTSVRDIDEIQVITTSATPKSEVQSITVSPIPGENSLTSMLRYSLKLDMTSRGGSMEFSGQISTTADAEGTSESLSSILGSMKNFDSPPNVTKSQVNADGGYTYLITFPTSMKDVPELEVYLSDVPVSISTIENANLLGGHFRLEYNGELTEPIAFDADEEEMQQALESLNTIGKVDVTRSECDEQNGYSWTITFLSELNNGNLDNMFVYSDGLMTSNTDFDGASVRINEEGGRNGTFISGYFIVQFGT